MTTATKTVIHAAGGTYTIEAGAGSMKKLTGLAYSGGVLTLKDFPFRERSEGHCPIAFLVCHLAFLEMSHVDVRQRNVRRSHGSLYRERRASRSLATYGACPTFMSHVSHVRRLLPESGRCR